MGIKSSVFASKSEKENYRKLFRTWGDKYLIYHNLPFLNIFIPSKLIDSNYQPFELSNGDKNRLKKTSVDYTLCDENDKPLLCIEFDGYQEGFNVGTDYRPEHSDLPTNPWRKKITELKLLVAHGSKFPFFVVNSKHFNDVSKDITLTIVDGIIGEVIASLKTIEIISAGFNPTELGFSEGEFDKLAPGRQQEIMQNWLLHIELETEVENNPIIQACGQLKREVEVNSFQIQPKQYPPIDYTKGLKERINQFDNMVMIGSIVTVSSDKYGKATGEAWLPNFKSPYYSGFGLIEEIATLIALENLRRANKIDFNP